MKKLLYLAVFAVLTMTACSNSEDQIFDQSAAERLEQYKKDYADVLTSDGGLWVMEYFSNPDEPGYLFVVNFDKGGAVTFHANHKWIGNTYKSETSVWRMIADNGPVLSFSSYNSLFHIFADPANITGAGAPTSDDGESDIDETGYGHEGDYEFQVMHVSDDQNTIRLMGKKYMYDLYLRRLDPSTDVEAYMNEYKQIESNLFTSLVPTITYTDSEGENYIVKKAYSGVLEMYPESDADVESTRTANFIITMSGIRFMKPLTYVNSKGQENTISEFKFVNNFGLQVVDNENAVMNAGSFVDVIKLNQCSWKVDLKSLTGDIKDAFTALTEQLKALYKYKSADVTEFWFTYDKSADSYEANFTLKTSAKNNITVDVFVTFADVDGDVKISIDGACTENDQLRINAFSELQNILSMLSAAPMKYSTNSDCGPKNVVFEIGNGTIPLTATQKK